MDNYKNLKIWNKSIDLAIEVYHLTAEFPAEEMYGITSQIRRSSVSISSNIAEGAGRFTNKDFNRFINIAYGSSCELESQLIISLRLGYISDNEFQTVNKTINQIQKMMYSFSKHLKKIN